MRLSTVAHDHTERLTLALLVLLSVLPLAIHGTGARDVLTLAMIYGIAAVSLDLFAGYAGQFSFAQFAFVGIGAYVSAIARLHGWSFLPSVVLALATCAAISFLLSILMVRMAHLGSALTTFFFAFVLTTLLAGQTFFPWTKGSTGLAVPALRINDIQFQSGLPIYYLTLLSLVIVSILTLAYADSRRGHALRLAKESEEVAAIFGISVERLRSEAFVFTSTFAGLAGVLYSLTSIYIAPEVFSPAESIILFAMVAVGGFGSVAGAIAGALFFITLPEFFRVTGNNRSVIFGLILLLAVTYAPSGLYGWVSTAWRRVLQLFRDKTIDAPPIEVKPPKIDKIENLFQPAGETSCYANELDDLYEKSPSVSVRDLSVSFGGVKALAGVSLEILGGSIHALVGPNGAGKTTLLNCISGTQMPSSGQIDVGGKSILRLTPQLRCERGLIRSFQHAALGTDLTAFDNVRIGLYAGGLPTVSVRARRSKRADSDIAAASALEMVGLDRRRWRLRPAQMTLGEQKLVDIARSLAAKPRVLILDEPTAGQSSGDMERLSSVIRNIRRIAGMTIIIVAHHVEFIVNVADRVTVLHAGRVLADGMPSEVLANENVIEVFVGAS